MSKNKPKVKHFQNKNTMPEKETTDVITEQQVIDKFGADKVSNWKKQYAPRKINVLVIDDAIGVLRPIGAKEISDYSLMVSNNEVGLEKASRYLIEELWIDGDRKILEDEEYFISAMLQSQRIIELKKSSFFRI